MEQFCTYIIHMEDRILTCLLLKRTIYATITSLTIKNHISSDICLYIYHDLTPSPIPKLHDRCYEFIVVENFIHPRPRAHHICESTMAAAPQFVKSWRFDTPMGHGCDFPLGSHGRALGRIFSCSAPMWSADLYRLVTRRGMFRDNLTTSVFGQRWSKKL